MVRWCGETIQWRTLMRRGRFVCCGPLLLYFKDERARDAQGFVLVQGLIRVDELSESDPLFDAGRCYSFRIQHSSRDLVCNAADRESMMSWVAFLRGELKRVNAAAASGK